jgi:hypothetical protein
VAGVSYCAEIGKDSCVVRVIVGTAEWANANLDGVWVDCDKIGIGWLWDGEVFTPPVVDEVEGEG